MAEMDAVEASGKTIDEAIDQALNQLGLDLNQVEVEILSEGRSGILGIGGEQARVRVQPLADAVAVEEDDEGGSLGGLFSKN